MLTACTTIKTNKSNAVKTFDFEAHRGGRGLMPENTIVAMKNAVKMDMVQTLEMDVVISKDKQVVVSHDPYFSAAITTTPSGTYLTAKEAVKTILYTMPYDSILRYDVGMKPYPNFPQQQKTPAYKPLLADLVDTVESLARSLHRTIHYNIEIKSTSATDNINHPEPDAFVRLVIPVLQQRKVLDRVVIQSFDIRPLKLIHQLYPAIAISLLVDKDVAVKIGEQINKLGFTPYIYSPVSTTVTQQMIDECHKRKMRIIPWTVNSKEEIKKMIDLGVDGLISDYPDLFVQFK
jgi:glycerophosphoryl diester phosphodiesterase